MHIARHHYEYEWAFRELSFMLTEAVVMMCMSECQTRLKISMPSWKWKHEITQLYQTDNCFMTVGPCCLDNCTSSASEEPLLHQTANFEHAREYSTHDFNDEWNYKMLAARRQQWFKCITAMPPNEISSRKVLSTSTPRIAFAKPWLWKMTPIATMKLLVTYHWPVAQGKWFQK